MHVSARSAVYVAVAVVVAATIAAHSTACHNPWIYIVQPGGDESVSGTIEVKAEVKKDVDWKKVEFLVDGTSIGADTVGPPYSIMWNTTRAKSGEHKLQAKGTLADGTVKESEPVTVKTGGTG